MTSLIFKKRERTRERAFDLRNLSPFGVSGCHWKSRIELVELGDEFGVALETGPRLVHQDGRIARFARESRDGTRRRRRFLAVLTCKFIENHQLNPIGLGGKD